MFHYLHLQLQLALQRDQSEPANDHDRGLTSTSLLLGLNVWISNLVHSMPQLYGVFQSSSTHIGSPEPAHLNRIPNDVPQLVVNPVPVTDDGVVIERADHATHRRSADLLDILVEVVDGETGVVRVLDAEE
jgi:hypothetical protein